MQLLYGHLSPCRPRPKCRQRPRGTVGVVLVQGDPVKVPHVDVHTVVLDAHARVGVTAAADATQIKSSQVAENVHQICNLAEGRLWLKLSSLL